MLPFALTNLLVFQGAWLLAALLHDHSVWMLMVLLVIHFWLSPARKRDVLLALLLAPLGLLMDGLLIAGGILHFNSAHTLPVWIGVLWILFVISLNYSLAWLHKLAIYWQVTLGALAGTGSYLAAERMQALSLNDGVYGLAVLALVWALLLPLLLFLNRYIGVRHHGISPI